MPLCNIIATAVVKVRNDPNVVQEMAIAPDDGMCVNTQQFKLFTNPIDRSTLIEAKYRTTRNNVAITPQGESNVIGKLVSVHR